MTMDLMGIKCEELIDDVEEGGVSCVPRPGRRREREPVHRVSGLTPAREDRERHVDSV